MTITVSAVIPCFNGAHYLAEAIASVHGQSRKVDELILVDDQSTDNSLAIAQSMGARVIRHSKNMGEGAARNTGVRSATGDVVCFIDADDVWLPSHVETTVGLLEKFPQCSALFAALQRFGGRTERITGHVPFDAPSQVVTEAFSDWLHGTSASCIRRSEYLAVGGFSTFERYSTDFEFWLRLSIGRTFIASPDTTVMWRFHGANQSTQMARQLEAVYRFRSQFLDQLSRSGNDELLDALMKARARIWRAEMDRAFRESDSEAIAFLKHEGARCMGVGFVDRMRWEALKWIPIHIKGRLGSYLHPRLRRSFSRK